ncbi:hypothetical protein [Profundibacter sp.]
MEIFSKTLITILAVSFVLVLAGCDIRMHNDDGFPQRDPDGRPYPTDPYERDDTIGH